MKNYQFDVELDLSLESDVEVRVTNDKYEANVIQYAARAHSVNNRIVLDFTASIRVLDPEFEEYALVNIDAAGLDLLQILQSERIVDFGNYFDITEFQTRDADRLEVLQDIVYSSLLVSAQFKLV